ncbi:methionine ABC transporter substrate-binding protein [Weissella diestrammenae]|uniref:Methionine ABC transporter substrate-binding protein n=1 Tax=Weissella diestrammenae TaxID=1162633 RepID=A0A7G9T755_9LACO|nr:MetQ/NlpA family ABC transporter substrate-binding protein [Weissella diestrammenae]MCM0582469.1 methionine ABC transporter substrate-binding protein [Weissella diestrammenae]QNN75930.1 methionine ABC transporter substrate-binding protein [Weissella diestrammenae]
MKRSIKSVIQIAAVLTIASTALTFVDKQSVLAATHAKKTIKVGINSPSKVDQGVWELVKKNAAKDNLSIKLVTFTDFNQPNQALNEGNLDANAYQHYAFLKNWNKAHHATLTAVGETTLGPGRLYSDKYQSVKEIPTGATVAVANDPTNEARALFLLKAAGLVELKSGVASPTAKDVLSSSKVKIKELAADQTLASLHSVDAAVISATFVQAAHKDPNSAIYVWTANNKETHQWVNIIAAQKKDKNKWYIKALVKAYHQKNVGDYINKNEKGASIAAWKGAPKPEKATSDTK